MMAKRVALVTGGGAGMGEAICMRFARDGRFVGVLDLDRENAERVARSIRENGGEAMALAADITRPGEIEQAVAAVHDACGPVDILVNNAGREDFAPFESIDSDNWDRMLEINLKGHYNATRAVLPHMVSRGWGRIINFTSIAAQNGAAHMVHYSAAKGGVIAMTRSLAQELGRKGITVNAIAPGLIDTPMVRRTIDDGKFGMPVEDIVRAYPVPRMGRPEEAAAAVAFFASEEAGYITAQLLGVNGGTAV